MQNKNFQTYLNYSHKRHVMRHVTKNHDKNQNHVKSLSLKVSPSLKTKSRNHVKSDQIM